VNASPERWQITNSSFQTPKKSKSKNWLKRGAPYRIRRRPIFSLSAFSSLTARV
jgi:hypothetical protein